MTRSVGNHGLLAFSAASNGFAGKLIDAQTPFPAGLDAAGADRALRTAYAQGMDQWKKPLVLTPMGAGRFDVVANWWAEDGAAMVVRSSRLSPNIKPEQQIERYELPELEKDHLKPRG